AVVDGGDDVAARGREVGRERRRAAGPDRDGPQDHVAVLEGDRAGGRAGPRGDGGHRGREGHRLAGAGRGDRRGQGARGRGGAGAAGWRGGVGAGGVRGGRALLWRTAFSRGVPPPTAVTSIVAWPLASSNTKPNGVLPL